MSSTMNLPGVTPELPHVRVGVSAVIRDKDGKFLVGKRKGSHGAGTLQTPGGHLEHGEDLGACAVRETEEETGLVVTAGNVITITNDVFNGEGKHYITIFVDCAMTDPNATPETKEPLKCEGWEWKSWDELKRINEAAASDPSGDKLFLPLVNLVKQTADLNALIASKSQ
ncbi:nudix hydrolase 1 [Trichoderma asperellum]|uniref:Nudix hydrolase 1 n=1 Tax=Trichoderma asperellum TaxID=101201 RepID=A0A6V8R1E1_TRIAP|nr:nudix hydrolase 1 [Trichoderma asperellum]